MNAKNHEREGEIIAEAGEGRTGDRSDQSRRPRRRHQARRRARHRAGARGSHGEGRPSWCSAPSGTTRAASTTSCAAVPAARRTRALHRFYVSLEDKLMRVFASETLKKVMGRFGIPEDEPIESAMITKSLGDRAGTHRGLQLRFAQAGARLRRRDEHAAPRHLCAPPRRA